MKNYKVEAIMKFTDKTENGIKRNVGDIFETTKERYEFLKQNNAVKLVEIAEEKKEQWAVTKEENGSIHVRPVVDGEIIDTPIEEYHDYREEKRKKKKTSKK